MRVRSGTVPGVDVYDEISWEVGAQHHEWACRSHQALPRDTTAPSERRG